MLKAIIFDFDGVICESVDIKKEAFRRLFLSYPKHVEKIVDYHMQNGGMSRFRKFDYIYQEILKEPLSPEQSKKLGELLTEYCYQGVVDCAYVKGAHEFVRNYHSKLFLFVVSGTPEEEMQSIVKQRKLDTFFKGVYGSPRTKGELNRLILKTHQLKKEETVFVGDSMTDYEGAKEAGIHFVGRRHAQYENPFSNFKDISVIDDLTNLSTVLKELDLATK